MLARGLRSSWAASVTKARWVARAASSRSSMSLRVVARAWISSWVAGTGRRSGAGAMPLGWEVVLAVSVDAPMRLAPRRRSSTGRSAAPTTRHAMSAIAPRKSGKAMSRSRRRRSPARSRSAVGNAATTRCPELAGPATAPATRNSLARAARLPAIVRTSPRASCSRSGAVTTGVSWSAVTDAATTRPSRSRTWTNCAPYCGTGSASRPAVMRAAISRAIDVA